MLITSPFGQLGLWAPSSGVREVLTSITYVRYIMMKMMMIMIPFGQLGPRAPSSGVREVFTSIAYAFTTPLDSDGDNQPVWPTWAVGYGLRQIIIKIIMNKLMPVQQNSFTRLRVLLVLTARGMLAKSN
jgi:hypothetical protein